MSGVANGDWEDLRDLRVLDDNGTLLYAGPAYLRCARPECTELVTHGMIEAYGSCWCGNRRLTVALRLRAGEKARLRSGYYDLVAWEQALIQPTLPAGHALGWGKEEFDAA